MAGLSRPAEVQRELLLRDVVAANAGCEFGQRHGFDRIHSVADYQGAVPLGTYEDFAAMIERTVGGESGVLTTAATKRFFLTSGSTA
jgi:hypothetical protein